MDGSSKDRAARIVRQVLAEQFADLHLVAVEIEEGYDAGGDPVLDVVVVYEPGDGELDISTVLGFVRHLRPALSEVGEERFPVMSYIPVDEHAATA